MLKNPVFGDFTHHHLLVSLIHNRQRVHLAIQQELTGLDDHNIGCHGENIGHPRHHRAGEGQRRVRVVQSRPQEVLSGDQPHQVAVIVNDVQGTDILNK